MKALLARHPQTTIIWAHTGLGRIIQPIPGHLALLEEILKDPAFGHVYFDISWTEVAKYVTDSRRSLALTAETIEVSDRFLRHRRSAPSDQQSYLHIYGGTRLWKKPVARRAPRCTWVTMSACLTPSESARWEAANVR
jgi:hypothetical protein